MLIVKHTIETKASAQDVWNIWQDVKNWNAWDHAAEHSSIDGEFKEGATGVWKAKGGPVLPLKLTKVEPMKMFVAEFKLFLARVVSSHYLTESEGKTRVMQQIEIKGPLAFFYARHVGESMKNDLPRDMEAMAKKAESLS